MIKLKDNILKNQKFIIYGALCLCIFIADFYLVLRPVVGGLMRVMPEVNSKASRANIMNIDIRSIQNYQKQINNYKANLSGYKRRFSTKEEISPLLKSLSDTAKTYGVKIVSITPLEGLEEKQAKAASAYRKIPIFLRAVSGYHSFGLFLNRLENSDTFMRVADLKISGDASKQDNHKFRVTILTYIIGAPKEREPSKDKY